jgi:hypothetical protein
MEAPQPQGADQDRSSRWLIDFRDCLSHEVVFKQYKSNLPSHHLCQFAQKFVRGLT